MCTVAAGSWGGRPLSLADYVMGTGATRGSPPPESAYVGHPLQRMEAGQTSLQVVPELEGLLGQR
jgi:hypothetical protein